MTEPNKQPVAESTEAAASPAAEVASAQNTEPSLDQILSDFDRETAKSEPAPQPTPQPNAADSEALREVRALKLKFEIEPILKRVRGDIPDSISDEELLDLLDGRAKRDPALRNAYLNKDANPRKWAQVEKALSAEYSKKF